MLSIQGKTIFYRHFGALATVWRCQVTTWGVLKHALTFKIMFLIRNLERLHRFAFSKPVLEIFFQTHTCAFNIQPQCPISEEYNVPIEQYGHWSLEKDLKDGYISQ